MDKKEIVCIACPVGCHLEITQDNTNNFIVIGAGCKRGEIYGVKELTNPTRLLTSTVRIKGGLNPVIPIRTDKEIPKEMIFECMRIINKIELEAPVKIGEIIIENILGLGVNVIASRSMRVEK